MTARRRVLLAFTVLFVCYQLPEGLGQHLYPSQALQAALLLGFYAAAYLLGRWLGGGMGAYGLARRPGWLRHLGLGLLLALGAKALALLVGQRLGVYAIHLSPRPGAALWQALPLAIPATLLPSVAEDIVTRGLWARPELRFRRESTFVLFSSGLYVLNHIYRLGAGPLEWLRLFCLGLPYAAALWRTKSLFLTIGLHWGWNLAGAALPVDVTVRVGWAAPLLSAGVHLLLWAAQPLGSRSGPSARCSIGPATGLRHSSGGTYTA